MVQRTGVGGISQMGRPTQGVRVMNMKEDDLVSAVALVVESADGKGDATTDPSQEAEPEASLTTTTLRPTSTATAAEVKLG